MATSGATLFRSMGGSLGTAALGAVFTARLTTELAGSPAAARQRRRREPGAIQRLPAAIRDGYTGAFTDALSTVFLVGAVIIAVAFLLSWLVEERPLRQTVETAGVGEAFASPTQRRLAARADPRALPAGRPPAHARVHRAHRRRLRRRSAGRRAWLLVQGEEGVELDDPEAITANRPIDAAWVSEQLDLLSAPRTRHGDQLTASGHAPPSG